QEAPEGKKWQGMIKALLLGVGVGLVMVVFVWLAQNLDVRSIFINISPRLINILTFEHAGGATTLFIALVLSALAGGALALVPDKLRNALLVGAGVTLLVGLLSEILAERLRSLFGSQLSSAIIASKA